VPATCKSCGLSATPLYRYFSNPSYHPIQHIFQLLVVTMTAYLQRPPSVSTFVERQNIPNTYDRSKRRVEKCDRHLTNMVDRDRVVGVATRYGLDGPGIESRWGRGFPHVFRRPLESTQTPTKMGTRSLSRGYSGRGVALTTYPT
jgi:hypothetical protein